MAVPEKQAIAFCQQAVALGLITADQAREGLLIIKKMKEMGIAASPIDEILQQKGFLKPKDVQSVLSAGEVEKTARPQIPGYEVIEKIGAGAMGVVWKAKQVSMDRTVAIKILSQRLSQNDKFVQRFQREARASAKLHHINIISGIDVGQAGPPDCCP
jgi:hypothetical protein